MEPVNWKETNDLEENDEILRRNDQYQLKEILHLNLAGENVSFNANHLPEVNELKMAYNVSQFGPDIFVLDQYDTQYEETNLSDMISGVDSVEGKNQACALQLDIVGYECEISTTNDGLPNYTNFLLNKQQNVSSYHIEQNSHLCDEELQCFSDNLFIRADEENSFMCDVCDKKCNGKFNFKIHMLTHSEQKSRKCNVCNKVFTDEKTLKKHKSTHTGKKPHMCDVCKMMCRQKSDLKQHKLIHTGEKPHTCDVCKKTV